MDALGAMTRERRLAELALQDEGRAALGAEPRRRAGAAFRRSFYSRSASGALVLVGPETLGDGPLHALCAEAGE